MILIFEKNKYDLHYIVFSDDKQVDARSKNEKRFTSEFLQGECVKRDFDQ